MARKRATTKNAQQEKVQRPPLNEEDLTYLYEFLLQIKQRGAYQNAQLERAIDIVQNMRGYGNG